MMTESRKWTHSLFALTMLGVFILVGTPLAGKGKPPPPTPTISYSITLLGTLGGFASEASGINERGDVVGRSQTADGSWAPFVYFIDTHEMVDLRDLLTPADQLLWRWDLFHPKGMNSAGQICGGALKLNESGPAQQHAVRITLPQQVGDTTLVEIVSPVASVEAWAEGINENGDGSDSGNGDPLYLWDVDPGTFAEVPIRTGKHCFGCKDDILAGRDQASGAEILGARYEPGQPCSGNPGRTMAAVPDQRHRSGGQGAAAQPGPKRLAVGAYRRCRERLW